MDQTTAIVVGVIIAFLLLPLMPKSFWYKGETPEETLARIYGKKEKDT